MCFLDTVASLRGRFSELTCPFFVLQGDQDKVTDPAGPQMLHENASSVNKRHKVSAFYGVCSLCQLLLMFVTRWHCAAVAAWLGY